MNAMTNEMEEEIEITLSNDLATMPVIESTSDNPQIPVEAWPHRPLFVQADKTEIIGQHSHSACPIGVPFEFETDVFKGKALIRFRGLDSSEEPAADCAYFEGRKRMSHYVIQGRFKKAMNVSEIMTGGEFEKPLKLKPPSWVNTIIGNVVQRVTPGAEMDLMSEKPKVLAPFAASVQALRVDEPGTEPDIVNEVEEYNEKFGGDVFGAQSGGASVKQRKEVFRDPKVAEQYMFETDMIYTFDVYDDSLDYVSYDIDLKVFRFDMTRTLDKEPFQIMAKGKGCGSYLWRFRIWHENLL